MKTTLLLVVAVGAAIPGVCSGQAVSFAISKQAQYQQMSDAPPTLDGFSAAWSISADTNDAFSDPCTVTFAGPISPLDLIAQGNSLPVGSSWYRGTIYYASQPDLEADVPAGDYTFQFSAGALPGGVHTVPLPESMFCDEIPMFTGDTWSRLQAIENDLGSDFEGTVNGFTDVAGSNSSGSLIYIFDYSHGAIHYAAFLSPEATSFTIPGGSIQPGYAYYVLISYSTGIVDNAGGVNEGASSVGFTRNSYSYFNTRGPCPADLNGDGVVDDADFVIFVAAYNLLYCSDALMPEGCASDLTNDGYVLDDDFVAFVPAYNDLLCP